MKKQLQLNSLRIFLFSAFSASSLFAFGQKDLDQPQKDGTSKDQVINEDLHVSGSLQVGIDCDPNVNFGFDTFILHEDNLRIFFNDKSASANFPANDWRFTFNDSGNGGKNFFAVDDVTGGKTPFRVEAGNKSNTLFLKDSRVAIGHDAPAVELHILDGDSPCLRLQQDNSQGWGTATWDIAGNEQNFFIRDVQNGSKLPFRIQPNSPKDALTIKNTGAIGIGTWSPNSRASIHMNASDKGVLINRMTTEQRNAFSENLVETDNGMMVFDNEENKLFLWNGTEWTTGSDDQDLTMDEHQLSIDNGNTTVDFSSYMDNTDAQELSLAENMLSISNAKNAVDLSAFMDNTDAQELSLADHQLSITNSDASVDLNTYLDNTDQQALSLENHQLGISNVVEQVDLSAYVNTDAQDLSQAVLEGNTLNLSIENGNGVSVDLSPILQPLQEENAAQQEQLDNQQALIEQLLARVEALEGSVSTVELQNPKQGALLFQNTPNPANESTTIKCYVPEQVKQACMVFTNVATSQVVAKVQLSDRGDVELKVSTADLSAATYSYSLMIDGILSSTKKMIVE